MFVRIKRIHHGGTTYEYLQVVATRRVQGRPRQQLVASLGRLDELVASGRLDRLILQLISHSRAIAVRAQAAAPGRAAGPNGHERVLIEAEMVAEAGLGAHRAAAKPARPSRQPARPKA